MVVMVTVVGNLCLSTKPQKGGSAALSAIIAQTRREITFVAAPRDALPGESTRETSRRGIFAALRGGLRDIVARNIGDDERGKFGLCRNADPRDDGRPQRQRGQRRWATNRRRPEFLNDAGRVKIMNGHIIASWQRDAPRHDTLLHRYDLR